MQVRKYDYKLDEKDIRGGLVINLISCVLELEKRANVGEFLFKNKNTEQLSKYKMPFYTFVDTDGVETVHFLMLPEIDIQKLKDIELSGFIFRFMNNDNINKILECGYKIDSKEIMKCFFYDRVLLLERLKKERYLKSFMRDYDCKILYQYDFEKVLELFDIWNSGLKQDGRRGKANREDFISFFQKENIKKYNIKVLYFEIDSKLIGVRVVFPFTPESDLLVLRYKINIFDHRGIDIFMNYKTTEIFDEYKEFTDGGDFTAPEFATRMKYKMEKWKPDRIEGLYVLKVL